MCQARQLSDWGAACGSRGRGYGCALCSFVRPPAERIGRAEGRVSEAAAHPELLISTMSATRDTRGCIYPMQIDTLTRTYVFHLLQSYWPKASGASQFPSRRAPHAGWVGSAWLGLPESGKCPGSCPGAKDRSGRPSQGERPDFSLAAEGQMDSCQLPVLRTWAECKRGSMWASAPETGRLCSPCLKPLCKSAFESHWPARSFLFLFFRRANLLFSQSLLYSPSSSRILQAHSFLWGYRSW